MPYHVSVTLPDGREVVAGWLSLITPRMRRIHRALWDRVDPDPADYEAVAAFAAERSEHVCTGDCDA